MSSRRWKTAASSQRTFGRCLPSSTRSLTSAPLKKQRIILKTGSPDLGPTWPEAWRKTKRRHRSLGAVLLVPFFCVSPPRQCGKYAGSQPTLKRRLLWCNLLLIRAKPRPSLFRGKPLCWRVLRRYFPPRKRRNEKKRLNAVCMRYSANTGGRGQTALTLHNIVGRGYQWYNILVGW